MEWMITAWEGGRLGTGARWRECGGGRETGGRKRELEKECVKWGEGERGGRWKGLRESSGRGRDVRESIVGDGGRGELTVVWEDLRRRYGIATLPSICLASVDSSLSSAMSLSGLNSRQTAVFDWFTGARTVAECLSILVLCSFPQDKTQQRRCTGS